MRERQLQATFGDRRQQRFFDIATGN